MIRDVEKDWWEVLDAFLKQRIIVCLVYKPPGCRWYLVLARNNRSWRCEPFENGPCENWMRASKHWSFSGSFILLFILYIFLYSWHKCSNRPRKSFCWKIWEYVTKLGKFRWKESFRIWMEFAHAVAFVQISPC